VEHVAQEARVVPAARPDHAESLESPEVIVREYEDADLDACRALFDELVETHRALYPGAEIVGEFMPEGPIFVAEVAGRVAGYAGLLWHGRRAELEPIVVAADQRKLDVGRALVDRVVHEARAGGAVQIFVRPTARNRDAIAFFHTVGFDVLGYVQLQIDLEARERRLGQRIAGREFRV
jgi:N-acetylglutamate synthase-like GNAT family acetyltransferase